MRKIAISLSAFLLVVGITILTLFLPARGEGEPINCWNSLPGCKGIKGCDAYYWEMAPSCKIWCYAVPPDGHPGVIQCEEINP